MREYVKEYKYNIGDIIELKSGNIQILEQIRMDKDNKRGYKYKCLKDNYISNITEYNLISGKGCPVCSNKKVLKGINDINTTHHEIASYFLNEEDKYKYTYKSGKEVNMKCPICNQIKKYRIATVIENKFSCDFCSDGISYGEKFIIALLEQINVDFKRQFTEVWCDNKRYDFNIENKYIIEVHGMQHYQDNKFNMEGCRTLKEEQENDILKQELALKNGIEKYIIIDCRYSTLDWIKKSILESELNNLYNLTNIDWNKCNIDTFNSRIMKSCKMYNAGCTTQQIANKLHVSCDIVRIWLNKCAKANLCDYNGSYNSKHNGCKKIKNNLTGVIYESISEASRLTNIDRSKIRRSLLNENKNEWVYI